MQPKKKRKKQCYNFFQKYRACVFTIRNAPEWPKLRELLDLHLLELTRTTFGTYPCRWKMDKLVLKGESFSALTTSQGMLMQNCPLILSVDTTPFEDGYWLRSSGSFLTALHLRSGKRRQVHSITTLAPEDVRDDPSEKYSKK